MALMAEVECITVVMDWAGPSTFCCFVFGCKRLCFLDHVRASCADVLLTPSLTFPYVICNVLCTLSMVDAGHLVENVPARRGGMLVKYGVRRPTNRCREQCCLFVLLNAGPYS